MKKSNIVWYNSESGETQIWSMNDNRLVSRGTVVDESGNFIPIGPPWSIVGVGDMNGNGKSDIVWYNSESGETQIWFMNDNRLVSRGTVVDESGNFIPIGLPFSIVGIGDMNGNGKADIVWYNSESGETQIWFMDENRLVSRGTVVDESGNFIPIGPPWSIVGVGDMNGNGKADIVWYNSESGETQIWFMNDNRLVSRGTVVDESGNFIPIEPPWSIVGVGDMNGNGKADIVWYNSESGETQIWFMDENRLVSRATVIDENGNFIPIGLPFSIVGIGEFKFREIAEQKIRELYLNSGAHRGLFGFPLSTVQFDTQKAEQRFAGGKIEFLNVTPKGVSTTSVRVRFVGFHCDRESDDDGLSDTDEPYFIIGVAGSNRSNTIRFGPYENVETGTDRFEAAMLADPTGASPIVIVPPIVIGVVAIEHDAGTPEEAEEKVRNIIKAIEEKFDQAAATFGATTAGSHVLPEWARDILIGWVPEGIAAVFGLGDDLIGSVPLVMFDFNPGLEKWETPPRKGLHGQNPYNTEILVDGGSEGAYTLRFQVEIAEMDITVG
jgi:FG-GAP-like repeat